MVKDLDLSWFNSIVTRSVRDRGVGNLTAMLVASVVRKHLLWSQGVVFRLGKNFILSMRLEVLLSEQRDDLIV